MVFTGTGATATRRRDWAMLDRFGLAGIRVSTDRTSYLPGEEVVVRVEAPARRAPELARAAVELVRTERVPGGQRKKGAGDERTDRGGTFDLDPRSNAD